MEKIKVIKLKKVNISHCLGKIKLLTGFLEKRKEQRFISKTSLGNITNNEEAYNAYNNIINREDVKKTV